jgi:hypothetical protein
MPGTITDVRRAADLAHAAGARCFVDAVHYAPHALVDVRALDCDFLACSAYKFYGPHIGILYGRLDLLEELDVPKLRPAPDTAPERLETDAESRGPRRRRGRGFLACWARGRRAASGSPSPSPGCTREASACSEGSGAASGSSPSSRCTARGRAHRGLPPWRSRCWAEARRGGAPSGLVSVRLLRDFYAATVVERLGLTHSGLVRAGCACYTSPAEVDRLVAGVAALG